jgi:hypothetical protein
MDVRGRMGGYGGKNVKNLFSTVFAPFRLQTSGHGGPKGNYVGLSV